MGIVSNAKEVADLVKKLGDIELYRKIVELESEIIELTRENHSLETRVQELTATLTVSQSLKFKEPFYYSEDNPVPFCPKCWEGDKTAIHLFNRGSSDGETHFECPHCKNTYWYRGNHA